jgi:hypothetical protein
MAEPLTVLVVLVHVGLLGGWLGSMLYSLMIVQPRAARFFAGDDDAHEAFLVFLGAGNRRPVLAIIAAATVTAVLIAALARVNVAAMLGAVVALAAATAVFVRVSWWLWPRRVFALPDERSRHRTALRRHAGAMVGLIGAALALAVIAVASDLRLR